jgi:hypothetical protein
MSFADTSNVLYWTSGAHVASNWTWTGVSRPFNYTNWAMNEPTQSDYELQACVYLYDGYMHDSSCTSKNYSMICEENCPIKSQETKLIDSKEFVNLGGRTYYFSLFFVSTQFDM